MNSDNLYFINTPPDVIDEIYYNVLEKLEDINDDKIVYFVFSSIFNIPSKYFFKVYIRNTILDKDEQLIEPDFLFFLS